MEKKKIFWLLFLLVSFISSELTTLTNQFTLCAHHRAIIKPIKRKDLVGQWDDKRRPEYTHKRPPRQIVIQSCQPLAEVVLDAFEHVFFSINAKT